MKFFGLCILLLSCIFMINGVSAKSWGASLFDKFVSGFMKNQPTPDVAGAARDGTAAASVNVKLSSEELKMFTDHIKSAKDHLATGRIKEASDRLLSALEIDADSLEANSLAGSCYLVLGRADLAEQFLYHAVHLSEWKDVVSVANLAEALRLNGDSALAIQVAIKGYEAVGKQDESGLIEYVLGASYADQGKYSLAAEWFLSAAMRQPKNVEAWLLASTMKFPESERNLKLAENVLITGLKENENSVDLVHHMGLVMHHTGKFDQAIKCQTFVVEQQPTHKAGLTMLATGLHAIGNRFEDAFNAYNTAVQHDGDNAILLSNFALLLHTNFNTRVGADVIAGMAERALNLDSSLKEAQNLLTLYKK